MNPSTAFLLPFSYTNCNRICLSPKAIGGACIAKGSGVRLCADAFGDAGTNTLGAIANHPNFNCPNLRKLGLFNIDGVTAGEKTDAPAAAVARLQEQSMGKDTTIGHWEIAGVVSPEPLPTFPEGFPEELIREYEQKTGHKVLCNKPYSCTGTSSSLAAT